MPKKIKSKIKRKLEKEEKKIDKSKIVWSIIVGFIMVASTIGFVMNFSSKENIKYNGYEFTYSHKYRKFLTRYNGKVLLFTYPPNALENETILFTRTPKIYVGFNNFTDQEVQGLGYVIMDLYNLYYKGIMIIKMNSTESTCTDLTLIIDKNRQNLSIKKNCIYLPLNELLPRTIDYIVYRYFNIIEINKK